LILREIFEILYLNLNLVSLFFLDNAKVDNWLVISGIPVYPRASREFLQKKDAAKTQYTAEENNLLILNLLY